MNWLDAGSCEAVATLGWCAGALGGVVVDAGILIAVILAPRLREHGGARPATSRAARWANAIPAVAAIGLWSWGLAVAPLSLRACYAPASAVAAAIVLALPMLVLFAMAAIQIARRSVW